MDKRFILLSVAAVILSFAGGFLLANALNRSELDTLRTENERLLKPDQTNPAPDKAELSQTEIDARIAEAEKNPQNFTYQKNLGIALYRYAASRKDVGMMNKTIPLMERALQLQPKDAELLITLGHTYFDIAYFEKKPDLYIKAETYYKKALTERPNDVDLIAEIGKTYFLREPADNRSASQEFERALKLNPSHEPTLEFFIQSEIALGNLENASALLTNLKKVNPNNESIKDLSAKLTEVSATGVR